MGELKIITALLAVLLATVSTSGAPDEALILVTGPKYLRLDRDYSFGVTSNALQSAVQANFTLSGRSHVTGKAIEPLQILNQRIPSNSFKTFKFKASNLPSGVFNLTTDFYDPFKREFYKGQILVYHRLPTLFHCFVHRDKETYNRGDTAQFSIFCIDSETKPYNPKKSSLRILDPPENIVKEFENLAFVKGKSKVAFNIPDKALDGEWNFEWEAGNDLDHGYFEVKKYVLPTHSIKIEIPKQVTFYTDKSFQVKLIATYAFGEFVEGEAVVTFYKNDYVPDSLTGIYSYVKKVLFTKIVWVDSAAVVIDVNIQTDLKMTYPETIIVDVNFTESLTKKVLETENYVYFKHEAYELIYSGVETYVANQNITIKLLARDIETGEPAPKGFSIDVQIYTYDECSFDKSKNLIYCTHQNGADVTYSTKLTDASGSIEINYTTRNFDTMTIYAYGSKMDGFYKQIKRSEPLRFKTEILTKDPQVGSPVSISISTENSSIKKCFFQMMSKEVLVSQGQVVFVNQSAVLTFTPSLAFYPKINIVFFSLDSEQLLSTQFYFFLSADLLNHVNLELSQSEVKPGQNVTLKVSSKTLSTVSIFAIDSAMTLLRKKYDFSKLQVSSYSVNLYGTYVSQYGISETKDFAVSHMFTHKTKIIYTAKTTTTRKPDTTTESLDYIPQEEQSGQESLRRSARETPITPPARLPLSRTRRSFVEVIDIPDVVVMKRKRFANGTLDPINAEAFINIRVPDSLTTFDLTAVAMNNIYGMAITDEPTSLKVFKNFFIQVTLPYNCKRTEVVILDINVFSYLDVNQTVTLSVRRNDIEFSVLEPSLDGWKTASNRFWQTYTARSKKPKRFRLAIKANILGFAKLGIDAVGRVASDSIEKILRIIPEGVPKSITRSVLVDKNDSEIYSSSLKCDLPPTAVSDTTSASASVAGDLTSYMINGLDSLIQMPGGESEQNMRTFVPSIVALKYLESTNQMTEKLRANAISYVKYGYQNQMSYIQKDKSVSFWGDGAGSTWLTAYVALAFKWASSYITIDSAPMKNMFNFLVSKQNPDGSFGESGYVSNKRLQGLSGKGLAMTAFVSIALSESIDKFPNFTASRNKALDYVALNVDENNVYDLCISAFALHLGGHVDADSVYEKMMEKSIETGDELKWEVARPANSNSYAWWSDYTPNTFNIEATAYALRVVLKKDSTKSLKAVKYLVSHKLSYGSNSLAQDIVQSLYSLTLFGSRLIISSDSLNFILTPDVGKAINHQVNPDNSVTVQDYTLNPIAQQLDIFSNDTKPGSAIVTLTCKFNEVADEAAPRFKVRTRLIRPCKNLLRQEICISFIDDDDVAQSNMALMTMTLPSGYVYDEDQLASPIIRLLEKEDGGTKVKAYFESFATTETCFEIRSVQIAVVEKLLSSYIEVVDYYSTDRRTQVSYNIPSDLPNCSDLPDEDATTTTTTTSPYYGCTNIPDYDFSTFIPDYDSSTYVSDYATSDRPET